MPDLDSICGSAANAFACAVQTGAIPAALDALAIAMEASGDAVISTCAAETALTAEELAPEFARMVGTLRLFASRRREGSWVRAAIDTRSAESIGPGHDVRSMLTPLGPVAVFGASNFPLAYGVLGGDTASALAAGCPVVVKEHPAHPRTGRLLKQIADAALPGCGLPEWLQYVHDETAADHHLGAALVTHRHIAAVGFTGSTAGGAALDTLARARATPIAVFAEMGSTNPVIITRAALRARAASIATTLADSILLRFGQQCTCPGLIIVPSCPEVRALIDAMGSRLGSAPARDMLAPWIRDSFLRRINECVAAGACRLAAGPSKPGPRGAGAVLLGADWKAFRANPTLREECFGPSTLIVEAPVLNDVSAEVLPPSLTCSVFCESTADPDTRSLLRIASQRAGRVIVNGVPTGVRVCDAMVHGGPWPATNRPDTTAVGPSAIERWCRPVCFQNCSDALLPPELQSANPLGILRTVNGTPTREARCDG